MSVFTVLIIIMAIFQLGASLKKRGRQQTSTKITGSFKLPGDRFVRDVIKGTSLGSWKEQLKQALENGPYQVRSLKSTTPIDVEEPKDYYVETKGTQGIEGTSEYVGILGSEAYKSAEETPREEMTKNPSRLSGVHPSLTERELVQGVMWAEILGKPRAMRSFRGPRT